MIDYVGDKIRLKVLTCLKQPKMQYIHGTTVNIYIVYELGGSSSNENNPTLKNSLLGAVALTNSADIGKYGFSGYGMGFDRRSAFLFQSVGYGQNVLIFGADISSSAHINNRKKDILVLGKGPTQGLEHTLTAGKIYPINFNVTKKKFCFSLYYNGANSYLLVTK